MTSDDVVEILLVEDNPNDEEPTLHAFRMHDLTWLLLNQPPISG